MFRRKKQKQEYRQPSEVVVKEQIDEQPQDKIEEEANCIILHEDIDKGISIELSKTSLIYDFKNWDKNRPPDAVRVSQIANYYKTANITFIPGVISAWKNPDSEILHIYDGIHRLLAAKEIDIDFDLLIKIWTTNDEEAIITDFRHINMSISVPFIYLHEAHNLKKTVCESVASKMCNTFPNFVSASRFPQQQNFNRDNLIEFISGLNIDFTKKQIDEFIFNQLIMINNVSKDHVKKLKIKVPSKCDHYGFYLFYLPKHIISSKIEDAFLKA